MEKGLKHRQKHLISNKTRHYNINSIPEEINNIFLLRFWSMKWKSSHDPVQPMNQSTAQARQLRLSIYLGFNFPLTWKWPSLNHAPNAIFWNTKIKVCFVSSVLKQFLLLVLYHCPCFQVHSLISPNQQIFLFQFMFFI